MTLDLRLQTFDLTNCIVFEQYCYKYEHIRKWNTCLNN